MHPRSTSLDGYPRVATAWSLFLAFLGAIVAVYIVNVTESAIHAPNYDPVLTFVLFPLLGSVVTVPICLALTLVAWGSFELAHRGARNSAVWANVIGMVLTVVASAAFYLAFTLIVQSGRDSFPPLGFSVAVVVIAVICALRGVGRQQQSAPFPAHSDLEP